MATKSKRHIHRYYRTKLPNNSVVWACAELDCLHHMPSHYTVMMLHKGFYCWNCGEIAQITQEHLDENPQYYHRELDSVEFKSHPICRNCAMNARPLTDEEINQQVILAMRDKANQTKEREEKQTKEVNIDFSKISNPFKIRR